MLSPEELKKVAQELRITVINMIYKAGSGHIGGSLSCAEIMTVLYERFLNIRPEEPWWSDRDRFILSKGHAAPMLYAVLCRKGFFEAERLNILRQLDSGLQGHPCMFKLPGIDMSTGSLGMGVSVGVGMIEEKYGQVNDFEGNGTDDTAIKLILCDAIISNKGYVTADEFAEAFLRNGQYYNLFYIPVRNMYHKIKDSFVLPVYAGLGNMQSSSSAMAISPMGLINACNPRQAALETYDVAGLIHAGDTTFCRDAACAIAAAVAEAMKPDATVDSIIASSTAYLHKKSSKVMISRIEEVVAVAKETMDYNAFREQFYEKFLCDTICDSRETVPCALALFYLANGDPVKSIVYAVNFGRDADTIGTIVGALAGAFKGIDGFKYEWIEKIKKNNSAQEKLAGDIVNIIINKMTDTENSINLLKRLVGAKS